MAFPIGNKGICELWLPPWQNELTEREQKAIRQSIQLSLDICFEKRPCWDYGLPTKDLASAHGHFQ